MPTSVAALRYGSMTLATVSAGSFTLVIRPSAYMPAKEADLGPPAAIRTGTEPLGGEYSFAVSVV